MIYGNKFLPKEYLTESKLNGIDYTAYDVKDKYKTDKDFIEENISDINSKNIYKTNGEILVDNSNGKVIGSVLIKDYSDGKWIGSLNVKPKYRQKGFGTLLLKDAVNKYKGVFLGVRKNNTIALEMYKKNGFEITSTFKEHYFMKLKSHKTKITYSEKFEDVKEIVDTLSKSDLKKICNGTFKNSPYVKYRKVCLVDNRPAAFIDIYSLPNEMESNEAVVVCACREEYRKMGLIKDCFNGAKRTLKSKGIDTVYWETTKGNAASNATAKSLGFKKSEDVNKSDSNYVLKL